jgi:hypothetical protein
MVVEARRSYEDVKRLVKIPGTWGAKITGEQFEERVSKFEPKWYRPPVRSGDDSLFAQPLEHLERGAGGVPHLLCDRQHHGDRRRRD